MEFHKIKIRIESGAVVGKGRFIDNVAEGDCTFVNKVLSGPDLPDELSGPPTPSNHKSAAPSVPRGG